MSSSGHYPYGSPQSTGYGQAGESQFLGSPTQYAPSHADFDFVSTSTATPDSQGSASGTVGSARWDGGYREAQEVDEAHMQLKGSGTSGGRTSQFLDNRGFGWLMEVDDEDDDSQKPLLEELDIDLKDIYYKLRCVLFPLPQFGFKSQVVRDSPDFWGPLVVVLLFSLLSLYGQFRVVSWIMTIWVFGSFTIFLIARVLGGEVSYSQCLGIIGYCLLPMSIMGFILPIFSSYYIVSFIFKMFGVIWSTYSSGSLLCVQELQHKKSLVLYPTFLLYIYFLSLYTGA